MQRTARRTPVLGRVDARYGTYRGAIILPGERASYTVIDRREVLERLVDKRLELPARSGRLIVRKEAICAYPVLVWKPCLESLSPYWPFYMVTVGAETIYVRIDGQVFTELHVEPGI